MIYVYWRETKVQKSKDLKALFNNVSTIKHLSNMALHAISVCEMM